MWGQGLQQGLHPSQMQQTTVGGPNVLPTPWFGKVTPYIDPQDPHVPHEIKALLGSLDSPFSLSLMLFEIGH